MLTDNLLILLLSQIMSSFSHLLLIIVALSLVLECFLPIHTILLMRNDLLSFFSFLTQYIHRH